jgi:hypothetical protein
MASAATIMAATVVQLVTAATVLVLCCMVV